MGFLDNVSDFMNKAGKSAADFTNDAVNWTKDKASTAKMEMDIKNKESKLEKAYAALGKKYFEENAESDDPKFGEIRNIKASIDKAKKDLAEKAGQMICPKCGASIPKDSTFCPKCGAKMDLFTEKSEEQPKTAEAAGSTASAKAAEAEKVDEDIFEEEGDTETVTPEDLKQ